VAKKKTGACHHSVLQSGGPGPDIGDDQVNQIDKDPLLYRDRHVVVTGGTGALGEAVVEALIAAGATCHIPVRGAAAADQSDKRVLTPHIDLTDEAAVTRFYEALPPLWASIHLAGGFAMGALAKAELKDFTSQIDINLKSCFLCCRAALGALQGRGGRIVNVAARPALEWRQGSGMAIYAAAKAGVAALTVALAEEAAKNDILVNAVAPSIIDTPDNRRAMPKAEKSAWPKPEEIAATIVFLASPENRVTRGAVVPVYGES
jgi:NAD(P)-dependent dehydrogenase (short-subunit alcohol dehydrogenase family)